MYTATFADAATGDNAATGADGKRFWTVDPGADRYADDVSEWPTAQTFQVRRAPGGDRFGAEEYYQNLDLVEAKAGSDGRFLYVSLETFGLSKSTADGKDTR